MEFNTKLGDILELNPTTPLKKGTEAKKVAMADVKENQKFIESFEVEKFKGGAKFKNGDTLVARITPCLENGKTAFVDILEENEIAFGSTEFFVIRSIENLTDPQYLYYLMGTPNIRNILIKSMTGTSGRQRAQKEALLNTEIDLPPLSVQQAIGRTLKNLDEKIKLNSKIIANLEELSQTLFKRWFIDFEFPDENGNPYKSSGGEITSNDKFTLPKGWVMKTIKEFANGKVITGKTPPTKDKENYSDIGMPFITIPDMHNQSMIITTERYISSVGQKTVANKIIPMSSIMVSCIATPGLVSITTKDSVTNQQINSFTPKEYNLYYLYFSLKNLSKYIIDLGSGGSTTLNLNKTQFSKIQIKEPPQGILILFHQLIDPYFQKIYNLKKENNELIKLRNALLPKLISGELELPEALEV